MDGGRPNAGAAEPTVAAAQLQSADRSRPAHDTVVAALEAGAAADRELFTLHVTREPEPLPARVVLDGAWRWSATLRRSGVRKGDRVPILLPTSADFVHAMVGTMLAGAVPVPLASPMTFGSLDRYLENLATVVEDAGARILLTSPRVRDALGRSERLSGALACVLVPEDLSWAPPLDPRLPSLDASHTALIQYTSGTTGRPKGAVISHGALTSNAWAIVRGLEIGEGDVGVSWLPLFHDMGLVGVVLTGLCHPYPIHLLRPDAFVMRPARWLTLLSETGATVSAAPNFAYELCVSRAGDLPEVRLDRWRRALNGAEPVQAATVRRFADRFGPNGFRSASVMPVYGMAESTLAVTFPALDRELVTVGATDAGAREAVSCGGPVAGAAVRVRRDGATVPEGVVGEIEVSGPSLMDGYYRNPDATAKALADGWLRTGDLGFVREGELFVVGRQKDVVIKGGRNIHPHDVERVAAEVPGVGGAVAAFGRPNDTTGTDDLVVVAEARAPDREQLSRAITGELLAALGVKADEVHLWPIGTVPRTTSGKVRRGACRDLLAAGGPR